MTYGGRFAGGFHQAIAKALHRALHLAGMPVNESDQKKFRNDRMDRRCSLQHGVGSFGPRYAAILSMLSKHRRNSAKSTRDSARSIGSLTTDGGEREAAASGPRHLGRPRLMTAMGHVHAFPRPRLIVRCSSVTGPSGGHEATGEMRRKWSSGHQVPRRRCRLPLPAASSCLARRRQRTGRRRSCGIAHWRARSGRYRRYGKTSAKRSRRSPSHNI